jgi:lipopolysaccharide export system protein LptC
MNIKERLRSWIPLLPLILLLAATYWLNLQVQAPAAGTGKTLRHDPDYIVDNFTATSLDERGKIRFVMSAKQMVHYPDDDTTLLLAPHLLSLSDEYPPWRMDAQNGELSHKGDEIFLRNDVIIVRPAYAKQSEVTFKTNYLHVLPNKNTADTDKPVSLVDARTNMEANGMELDYKAHVVKFLSRVKTVYEPVKK